MKCVFFNFRDKSVGEEETMNRITSFSMFTLIIASWIMSETSISTGESLLFSVKCFNLD
jgi:hypothetical protein